MNDTERVRSVQSEESEDVPWKQLQQLDWWIVGAPPKTSMEPENDGFQKESPFPGVYLTFQQPGVCSSLVTTSAYEFEIWIIKSPEVLKLLKLGLFDCFQLFSLFAFLVFTHFLGFICEEILITLIQNGISLRQELHPFPDVLLTRTTFVWTWPQLQGNDFKIVWSASIITQGLII